MSDWRLWLPKQCLASGRTAAPFASTVDGWLRHWFVKTPFAPAAEWSEMDRDVAESPDWTMTRSIAPGLGWQERHGASDAIAGALFPASARKASASVKDADLFGLLGRTVLDDLSARLLTVATELGGAEAAGAATCSYQMPLRDAAGRPVLRLLADEGLLVFLAKRGIAAERALPVLADRETAIAGLEIEAAALAGRARLSYAELRDLAAGDVLIIDAGPARSFDLLVDGTIAAGALISATTDSSSLFFSN